MREQKNESYYDWLKNKIKSVDGVDELASTMAIVLPGIAGASAATGILTVAAPFVYLGCEGMQEEYEEGMEELEDRIKKAKSAYWKIEKPKEIFEKPYQHISHHNSLENIKDPKSLKQNQVQDIIAYKNILAKLSAEKHNKHAWLGAKGMQGMFLGIITGMITYSMAIYDKLSKPTNLALATAFGATLSSVFFIIGQFAMILYALNRYFQGESKIKILDNYQNALPKKDEKYNPIHEILNRERELLNTHSVSYGQNTVAGQLLMMTATILTLLNLSIFFTLPFFAIGTILTLSTAIIRVIADQKQERFQGKNELDDNVNVTKMKFITDNEEVFINSGLNKKLAIFELTNHRLAFAKILSNLHIVINEGNSSIEELDLKMFDFFESKNHKSYISNTKELIKSIYTENREDFKQFLTSTNNKIELNEKLLGITRKIALYENINDDEKLSNIINNKYIENERDKEYFQKHFSAKFCHDDNCNCAKKVIDYLKTSTHYLLKHQAHQIAETNQSLNYCYRNNISIKQDQVRA